ncbi:MAG: hypothetical protein CMK09_04730 [Ponticaulis sp.]|nr:hypothetical protein [Ponticaulis sp.]|tara:strand:+ start:2295 stop:2753 length:459 start_codon:yes stop_codon:yes gene_type:complete
MRIHVTTAILAASLGLVGCGGKTDESSASSGSAAAPSNTGGGIAVTKEQKLANTYLAELSSIADAIESVTDEASAQEAAQVIRAAGEKMEAEMEAFGGDMNGPQAMAIFLPRQQEFIQVQTRVSSSMARLAGTNPQLMQTISKEMSNLPMSN